MKVKEVERRYNKAAAAATASGRGRGETTDGRARERASEREDIEIFRF